MPEPHPESAQPISITAARSRLRSGEEPVRRPYELPSLPPPPSIPHDDGTIGTEPPPPSPDWWSPTNALDNPYYDPDQFYTATSLSDEGTTSTRTTMSKSIMYMLEAIVQSKRFPEVLTVQDAIRDAVAHWLQKRSHRLPPHIEAEIAEKLRNQFYASRMEARRRGRLEVEGMIETTDDELNEALAAHDYAAAEGILRDAGQAALMLSGPAKTKMQGIIERGAERIANRTVE